MTKSEIISIYQRTVICLVGALGALLLIIGAIFIEARDYAKHVTCESFASYEEAVKNYPLYPQLDRNHNGIPCEDLIVK